jgi:spore maturation protein CgeD
MSFGGFGGIPRKPGGQHEPELGVVKGVQPGTSKPKHKPKLGRVQEIQAAVSAKPLTLGPPTKWTPLNEDVYRPASPLPYSLGQKADFHVIILSKLAHNLKGCLAALLRCEKELPQERVIVVDDGAAAGCVRYFPKVRYIKGVSPFIFARNANIGIQMAGGDIVLLNDDALLMSQGGLSELSKVVSGTPELGLCSAAIFNGMESGTSNHGSSMSGHIRREDKMVPFVCIYIPKRTINQIGFLDEQFSGYGYDDNDYCKRVSNAGLEMGIFDGCVVDHGRKDRSTFRSQPNLQSLLNENKKRFDAKWGGVQPPASAPGPQATPLPPPPPPPTKPWDRLKVTCILTSYNRPNLVRQALKSLQDQTHRNFEVLVFDDSSQMNILPIVGEFKLPISQVFMSKVTPQERRTVNRLSVNINKGLKAATGDLVCFLADDDYYFPTWFEMAAKYFHENQAVNVGFGKLVYSSVLEMDFNIMSETRWPEEILKSPFERVDHNQVIHRRFAQPFAWPEDFKTVSNPDAHYFRAVATQHPFYPINTYAAVKRMHSKNLQKTIGEVVSEQAENIRE